MKVQVLASVMNQSMDDVIHSMRLDSDAVIINQLHMLEYIKHENNIFLITNQKRFKNGKHEVFIQHIDDPKQNLWFDIQGLTKVEILESKKEANP